MQYTKRPRNVNTLQAASILYGDWGTSKAYVVGLAFALAAYSSFWLIALVGILNLLIGINYITICKCYPNGGGVYASVYARSKAFALFGALCITADYLLTAAISALSAFYYLGIPHPEHFAILAIGFIGFLNYFGPRHTGNLAFLISVPTVVVILLLGLLCLPFLGTAFQNVQPLSGGFAVNWISFVGIIVALSGVESIANATGVMKLDPGSTENEPSIKKTSTPAIISVMLEVSIMTTLLGLALNALPGLYFADGTVMTPGHADVRDYMLRYMAEVFGSQLFGPFLGHLFSLLVSLMIFALLLSAVNTALVALSSLLFVMSRDGEMPDQFQILNGFGVPLLPLVIAAVIPGFLIYSIPDVAGLADLYAIGFVGAIAVNLGSTSIDFKLPLKVRERGLMMLTFLIMVSVEVTLFIFKPHARNFALAILAIGLFLRQLVMERRQWVKISQKARQKQYRVSDDDNTTPLHEGAMLCAVTHIGKTLEFALEECKNHQQALCLLFVREQQVITAADKERSWIEDEEACEIFDYAQEHLSEISIRFFYLVSDSAADSIVKVAENLKVSRIILGMPRSHKLYQLIRGNIVQEVSKILPGEIDLVVIS